MDNNLYLLAGTYTKHTGKGIYLYRFNQQQGTAAYVGVTGVENPSYLAVTDNRHVYAVSENEQQPAYANALFFDKKEEKVQPLNRVETQAAGPCYIATDNKGQLAVTANYGGGSISVFGILPDGKLSEISRQIAFTGSGPDKERQEAPHPHCIKFSPDDKFVFITDLGTDTIYRFALNYALKSILVSESVHAYALNAGSGPRHLEFHPSGKYLYLISEMAGTVTVFGYNNGDLTQLQTVQADKAEPKSGGDLKITPNGKYLFASNRHGNDGVTIYAIHPTTGMLHEIGYEHTAIHPRNIEVSPNGKFLLVAGMESNLVEIYEITASGKLKNTNNDIEINMPVCLKFIG